MNEEAKPDEPKVDEEFNLEVDDFIVRAGGKDVNVRSAAPLTLKDWMNLEKDGVTASFLAEGNIPPTKLFVIWRYIIQKSDPSVKDKDIEEMPLDPVTSMKIIKVLAGGAEFIDPPSSTP